MSDETFEEKVLATLARLDTKMDATLEKQRDHEKRIRFLEKGIFIAIGILIIVDIILTVTLKVSV